MNKPGTTHLIKLCVGRGSGRGSARLAEKPPAPRGRTGLPRHVTRMWPKRAQEVLNGGSLYWVFKGLVLCRQRVLRFDEVDPLRTASRAAASCSSPT